jgi:hypothetical protein
MKTSNTLKAIVSAMAFIFTSPAISQSNEGFIYGEITTIDDQKYKGALRWGKEEIMWDHLFNATKDENPWVKLIDRKDMKYVINNGKGDNWDWEFMNLWEDKYGNSFSHQFVCRFGDISKLRVSGRDNVELTYKSGEKIRLAGGSNDVGAKIRVYDPELGEVNLAWDRIETIQFMERPSSYDKKFGEPLYGTIKTDNGDVTGFIQWDHEEAVSSDVLDGENQNGKMALEFGNIKTISRWGNGVKVVLKSGRDLSLWGSNDVNDGNRGIAVHSPEFGKVLIKWDEFISLTFEDKAPNSGDGYGKYKGGKQLSGSVKTQDGETFSGKLVYDLDEYLDTEILDGHLEGSEYSIPFSAVKKITVKNYEYTNVELKSGKKLLLSGTQDVTDKNDGILVFASEKDQPKYIPWEKVSEVIFN